MVNNAQMVFDGTPTTVIATTGTIADAVFSVASTNATITEFDNSAAADRWPFALAILKLPDSFAAAPDANSSIDLYMCRQNLAGDEDDDEKAPTTTDKKGAKYIGSFPIYDTDEAQVSELVISLVGVRQAKFYIKNKAGQTLSYSSGATVEIEGFTYTPST